MALKVCTTAFSQGAYGAKVGDTHDSSSYLVSTYPSFFSSPKRDVVDTSGVYATPVVLTEAQAGARILVDDAAGLDFTLPAVAAAQVGTYYEFLVSVTVSSNNFRVTAAAGDLLRGGISIQDFDTANTIAYFAPDEVDDLVMTCNGGTKGGKKGSWVCFTAITATGWMVHGSLYGDGALATPFS